MIRVPPSQADLGSGIRAINAAAGRLIVTDGPHTLTLLPEAVARLYWFLDQNDAGAAGPDYYAAHIEQMATWRRRRQARRYTR